ncbi:MAG TPA: Flp pilus assembly protein CpaB [Phenylobacterium sp.]|nr:Flp pilus assembly protein CpaB [Phenylobacterium sp.]
MRNLGLVLVALSILIGGAALWGLKILGASHAEAAPVAALPRTAVVVAARPIGFGEPIAAGDLKLQPWPAGAVPAGAFASLAALTTGPQRLALAPIAANAPILPSQISGPGGRATLAGLIRPGLRAATLRVDDVLGVAGFVLPGDSVDILVTRGDGTNRSQMRTDVLLQGVRVLAVDQLADEAKNKPVLAKAATVEVTPAQAEKIALAAQIGTLSLALRSSADPSAAAGAAGRSIRVADLGGDAPRPLARRVRYVRRPAAAPASQMIEIVRGGEVSRVAVPAG